MTTRRKGWCPGALRPMRAADGYLVRLRITAGRLPAEQAAAIARLALAHGNGLLDLSARANLQIRSVPEAGLAALRDGLAGLGLLDATPGAESIRNVMVSPLSGLGGGLDLAPLAAALERELVATTRLHDLPGKFGFLIDDGTAPHLAAEPADLRFDYDPARDAFAIGLGGTRQTATYIGDCLAADLPGRAVELGRASVALLAKSPAYRRMADLRRALGPEALARHLGGVRRPPPPETAPAQWRALVGRHGFAGGAVTGFAAPFGRLDAPALTRLAGVAAATARGEIRLSPWRVLFVPGTEVAALEEFVTDAADPRLRIAACAGLPGCAEATRPTQADAAVLAPVLAAPGSDIVLHVSGCPKGCAKPSATALTLVARAGGYDLVRNGRADAAPERTGLSLDAARRLIEAWAW